MALAEAGGTLGHLAGLLEIWSTGEIVEESGAGAYLEGAVVSSVSSCWRCEVQVEMLWALREGRAQMPRCVSPTLVSSMPRSTFLLLARQMPQRLL